MAVHFSVDKACLDMHWKIYSPYMHTKVEAPFPSYIVCQKVNQSKSATFFVAFFELYRWRCFCNVSCLFGKVLPCESISD